MFIFNGLKLEKLTKEDLSSLLELKVDSWETTHRISILTLDDQNKWYDSLDQNNMVFTVALGGLKIGIYKIFDIDWINRTANVGWDIFKSHRGKGKGKALVRAGTALSFKVLNLRRLNCEILETNLASIACAESAGFLKEGNKRQAIFRNDKTIDSYVYGILNTEFTIDLLE